MTSPHGPADLTEIATALCDASKQAGDLVGSLPADRLDDRPDPGAWSVAQCLDHLARTNRIYSAAMRDAAMRALHLQNSTRRGPIKLGWLSRWFVGTLEPPVKRRIKAPDSVRPAPKLDGRDALRDFMQSQTALLDLLEECKGLDLNHVRFANPFFKAIRFTVGAGFHILAAHNRRHLWQAANTAKELNLASMSPSKG